MPIVNAWETFENIQGLPLKNRIQVILVSASITGFRYASSVTHPQVLTCLENTIEDTTIIFIENVPRIKTRKNIQN